MKSLLAKLWLILTARCEHASRVASDELDGRVSASDRLAARLHEVVCPGCRHARSQFHLIDEAMKRASDAAPPASGRLSEEARERMRATLRAEIDSEH